MKEPATLINNDGICLFFNGKTYNIPKHHINYDNIVECIKSKNYEDLDSLVNVSSTLESYSKNAIKIINGEVYYNNEVIHNTLTKRIIEMYKEGFSIDPMVNFLENLMQNPSKHSVDELYLFMESGKMPITPDGHFLAYKNVNGNFKDLHSNTFDNSPGNICEMQRNRVDDNKNNVCSNGLHFCSVNYLKFYGDKIDGKTVIVKINPRDVVSIPIDHNYEKGRTCRYEVIGVHEKRYTEEAFTSSVHYDNDFVKDSYTSDILNSVEILRSILKSNGIILRYKSPSTGSINEYPRLSIIKNNEVEKFEKIVTRTHDYEDISLVLDKHIIQSIYDIDLISNNKETFKSITMTTVENNIECKIKTLSGNDIIVTNT